MRPLDRLRDTGYACETRSSRTYPHRVSDLEDPDYDAWEAAALVSPEELDAQLQRDPVLGSGKWQLWKGRVVEDTPPLESYEPHEPTKNA